MPQTISLSRRKKLSSQNSDISKFLTQKPIIAKKHQNIGK
jgi:hypothetical protein